MACSSVEESFRAEASEAPKASIRKGRHRGDRGDQGEKKVYGDDDDDDEWHYVYKSIIGIFHQDVTGAEQDTFDIMREKQLGLIEQEYDTDESLPACGKYLTQWQRFAHKVKAMNQTAPEELTHRVLYLGRHGQGFHNVGIMFYGDDAWDCHYCTFDQDPRVPRITYLDAHLTLLGRHQAQTNSMLWQNLISTQKISLPETYYCSPHSRAIQTAQLTFSTLLLPQSQPFRPVIKESLREVYGIQRCDLRPTRSYIQEKYPNFRFEESFTETDELFSPAIREPLWHLNRRVQAFLDDIFAHNRNTYISITSHSGPIKAILRAIGHAKTSIPTGGIIPVFISVRKIPGKRYFSENDKYWEVKPTCTSDPLKAAKQGYKDVSEYLREFDRSVPGE